MVTGRAWRLTSPRTWLLRCLIWTNCSAEKKKAKRPYQIKYIIACLVVDFMLGAGQVPGLAHIPVLIMFKWEWLVSAQEDSVVATCKVDR
jgi:hypothetical protein